MPLNLQRENTGSPESRDSIADMFGLPTGQSRATLDATPARSSRFNTVLSWLWQFLVDGFVAYGLAMYPCFEDPNDLLDLFAPPRRTPAGPAPMAPPDQSLWQFENLARGAMTVRLSDDTTFAEIELGTREHGTGRSGAP